MNDLLDKLEAQTNQSKIFKEEADKFKQSHEESLSQIKQFGLILIDQNVESREIEQQ